LQAPKPALHIPSNLPAPKNSGSVHLFVSYFQTGDPRRDKELNSVMQTNIECPSITKIFNLGLPYQHPKVENLDYQRPTYADFVSELNKHAGDYNIIANSDIFFDSQIEKIKSIDFQNTCLALTRYDVRGKISRLFTINGVGYEYSQDTWIFKGKINPVKDCEFLMGKPGCDNRFAYELSQAGYRVINPCNDIRTYHLHEVNIRSYKEADRIHGSYLPVKAEPVSSYLKRKCLIHQPGKVGDILIVLPIAKVYSSLQVINSLAVINRIGLNGD